MNARKRGAPQTLECPGAIRENAPRELLLTYDGQCCDLAWIRTVAGAFGCTITEGGSVIPIIVIPKLQGDLCLARLCGDEQSARAWAATERRELIDAGNCGVG